MKKRGRIPRMPGGRLSPARQLALSLLAGLLLGLGAIVWLNCQLRPMVLAVSESTLSNQVSRIVSRVLGETEIDYSDLVQLRYDESGTLSAVTTQMETGNRLRGALVSRLLEELSALEERTVSVPAGSLTGLTLLSGRGVHIPVEVVGVSDVDSRFDSSLTPAGINQTLHRIDLVVMTDLTLLLPGGPVTVLVGAVPENYTYFSQFDTAEEAANAYFDYGAEQN